MGVYQERLFLAIITLAMNDMSHSACVLAKSGSIAVAVSRLHT